MRILHPCPQPPLAIELSWDEAIKIKRVMQMGSKHPISVGEYYNTADAFITMLTKVGVPDGIP